MSLLNIDLENLCYEADSIRNYFCGNRFDICTIINGKCGKCSEDCKYCAQSAYYQADIKAYPLLDTDTILKDAKYNYSKGVLRYSVVTSGQKLNSDELDKLLNTYELLNNTEISICASHGLLDYDDLVKLKKSGVSRYHNNLETSENYFPKICTTHTFRAKINTIKAAQKAGLEICSGGIMGLGETMEDRIDMAFSLRSLNVTSIPLNILNPISGTPFENNPILGIDEVRRIVAIYRFILPKAAIRIAGGRFLMSDKGKNIFKSGANAAITGDMLTTKGITIDDDKQMIAKLGYEVAKL